MVGDIEMIYLSSGSAPFSDKGGCPDIPTTNVLRSFRRQSGEKPINEVKSDNVEIQYQKQWGPSYSLAQEVREKDVVYS